VFAAIWSARPRRMLAEPAATKGGLTAAQPLALTCADPIAALDGQDWYASFSEMVPTDCARPHAEFAGIYTVADGPYPGDERAARSVSQGWRQVVARFLGLSVTALDARGDIGFVGWGVFQDQWLLGDRVAHRYVLTRPPRPVRSSLKRLGKAPLPS
jgi:hypothetical protein